jgi:hypothetical protein
MLSSKFDKKETMIHMHGFDIMLFSWGSLQRVRGWWILCLLFYTEKKAAIFVSLLSKTHNLSSSSSSSSTTKSIIQSFSDTLNWTVPLWEEKRDLRGFQKLIKTASACLLSNFTVQKTRWDKFDTLRASPVVLSMWPCESLFAHPKFSYKFCLQTHHKTETGAANGCGTTNSKPPGPIIMMGQWEALSSSQVHIYYTLFSRWTTLLLTLPATANCVMQPFFLRAWVATLVHVCCTHQVPRDSESHRVHTYRGALQFYYWTLAWLRTMIEYWRKEFLYFFLLLSLTYNLHRYVHNRAGHYHLYKPFITSSELGG